MSIPVIDPGNRGDNTTDNVAALITAMTLPSIEPFGTDTQGLVGLPAYTHFPCPAPEPPSRVSVARAVHDAAITALAALKCLEDRTAACKAALITRLIGAAAVEATALALGPWQSGIFETSATAEIATTLCIPEGTATALTCHATELIRHHPDTLAALETGVVSFRHVAIILDECHTLNETPTITPTDLNEFETQLLSYALGTTAARFASKARRARESTHPETLPTRTKEAISKRAMTLDPGKDSMAWLTLHLPAVTAKDIWSKCTRAARQQQGPNEHRTLTHLRIDTAATLLQNTTITTPVDDAGFTGTQPDITTDDGGAGFGGAGFGGVRLIDIEPVWAHTGRNPGIGPQTREADQRDRMVENEPGNMPIPGTTYTPEPTTGTGAGFPYTPHTDNSLNSFNGEEPLTGSLLSDGSGYVDGVVDGLPEDSFQEYLEQLETTRQGLAITGPPLPDAQIIVTIPVLGLLGATNQPATLAGYGPIPETIARKLLNKAGTFLRVLTDPISGKPLDTAPDRYRLREAEKLVLRAMAETCSFPNCNTCAQDTETDHTTAYEHGGKTINTNQQPLCRRHHYLKHFKDDKDKYGHYRQDRDPERVGIKLRGWSAKTTPDGHTGWTSPTGKYHPPQPSQTPKPTYPTWLKKRLTEDPPE